MAFGFRDSDAADDPLFPWLLKIRKAMEDIYSGNDSSKHLDALLYECISTFKHDARYQNDVRFLKIWYLYLEGSEDFERVYGEIEENKICIGHSSLYEWYALFLEVKGLWQRAQSIYQTGFSRKAEPLDRLKEAYSLFIKRLSKRANAPFLQKQIDDDSNNEANELETGFVNPWSASIVKALIHKINPQLVKYTGYYASNKAFPGKANLASLQNSSRNKIIEIGSVIPETLFYRVNDGHKMVWIHALVYLQGGRKYQIKGCAGQGAFALVFKAYVNSNPDEVVALKIQDPPFPWEFHMYRQLDRRIPDKRRPSFGLARRMHLYSDYSILICDYLSHGTLQDVINSYVVVGKSMEEVLCMYYTVEMLYMLETLHSVGIIHGDFKPDNLLVRYSSDNLTEEGFCERSGPWSDQGLCLVDWGRGIDLKLFPGTREFTGDCRTSGFRCVEMKENKPWKFQVDTYGLCVIVHMMLHNKYMEVEKKPSPKGGYVNLPSATFRRYWKVEMWKELFTKLLNSETSEEDTEMLRSLRKSFEGYICSDPKLLKKLKELLAKQRVSLCSS